ncbi:MAG: PAS domain S-box protein [Elusimicrobia bacterium]|nr:PAS domain S-box protein [Elusimicrobiota bacterium]
MLDTVKVPKQFEPIFEKAQEYVSKYFKERKEDPTKGTIEIFGQRYILVRAASMSVDFFDVVKELYKEQGEEAAINIARQLLFDIAHTIGKQDAKNFHNRMQLKDPIEKLSAGPIHFSYSGWAFVDIFPESRPSADENFYLIYDHPFSFESDAWEKKNKKSNFPVCVMNAGYSSGWCEESFGVTLVASEIMCKAKGDEVCRFIMAHPSKIEDYIREYLKKEPELAKKITAYEIPSFFKIKQIEEERRKAADALRSSEEKFRAIFDNANDGMLLADLEARKFYTGNSSVCQMLGYSLEEMKKLGVTDIHPKEDLPYVIEQFERQLRGEIAVAKDLPVKRKDGSVFYADVNSSPVTLAGKTYLLGIFRDITERKKAEDKIDEQRKFLEKVLKSLTYPFYVIDVKDYTIKIANSAAGFGDLSKGLTCYALTHRRDSPCTEEHICPLKEVMRTKKPVMTEHIHYDKDGNGKYFEVHGDPIFNSEGNVVQMIEYSIDITERKQAEKALRESEDYLGATLRSIGDGVISTDSEGNIISLNSVAEKLTGWLSSEAKGRPISDVFHIINTQTREAVESPVPSVIAGGRTVFMAKHTLLIARDGTEHQIDDSCAPICDINGKVIGTVMVLRDITEEYRVREALKEKTALLSSLLDSIPDLVFYKDKQGVYLGCNPEFARFVNRDISAIIGFKDHDLFSKEVSDSFRKQDQIMLNQGMPLQNEEWLTYPDGTRSLVDTLKAPLRDADGQVVGLLGLSRNITERKLAEEFLRDSEERFRSLFTESRDAMMTLSPEAGFMSGNPAAIKMFACKDEDDFISKSLGVMSPEYQPDGALSADKAREMMALAIKEGSRFFEWVHKSRDGTEFPATVLLSKFEIGGKVILQATVRDISQEKRAEQEMKEAVAIKSDFISMVSHELRTPLGVIMEGINIVLDGSLGECNEKQKDFLSMAKRNVDRLGRLINDVLVIQKMEAGMMKFNVQEGAINEAVRDIWSAMLRLAEEKGLRLEMEIEENLPKISFDSDRILQVLTNLLNNAIKFTEKGVVAIKTEKMDNVIKVSVSDTGPGIRNEDMHKLFGKFEQISAGNQRKTGGTGLGLAISRNIIEQHRGKIWAESEFGKGTIFSFTLPIMERRG